MNNTIPFRSATHAPQITVDVNILTMLKQAALECRCFLFSGILAATLLPPSV